MKKILILILLSITIVLAVAYRFIQITPIGTGETCESPDRRYHATASEWISESFFGKKHHWFEFTIEDLQSGQVVQKLKTDPIAGPYFGSRSNHSVVCWNDDSTEVIFKFPSIDIKMRVDPNEDSG